MDFDDYSSIMGTGEIVWLMMYVKCHFIGIVKRKTG
jgi:hypothetical protein